MLCWNFVSERLSQQHVMNHFETNRKFIEEKYRRSLQRTAKSCGTHVFGVHRVHRTYSCSTVTEDVKKTGIKPSRVKNSYHGPNCSGWMFTWQISKHWSACHWILRRTFEVTDFCVHPAQCQMNFTVSFHVLCNCRYKFYVHRKHVLHKIS